MAWLVGEAIRETLGVATVLAVRLLCSNYGVGVGALFTGTESAGRLGENSAVEPDYYCAPWCVRSRRLLEAFLGRFHGYAAAGLVVPIRAQIFFFSLCAHGVQAAAFGRAIGERR